METPVFETGPVLSKIAAKKQAAMLSLQASAYVQVHPLKGLVFATERLRLLVCVWRHYGKDLPRNRPFV